MSGPVSASNWRKDYPILVPNAHAVAMLGVIRSLGRAGYPVHATAEKVTAMGLRSRYASKSVVHPPYGHAEYIPWLRSYLAANGIRGIAPAGVLLPIREHFAEFQPYLPIPRDAGVMYRGMSKYEVFSRLQSAPDRRAAENVPPTLLLRDGATPEARELERMTYPAFVKTESIDAIAGGMGGVKRVRNADEARREIERSWKDYRRLLIQGFAPGRGAAAAFVIWKGRMLSRFMNVCLHETPHTGGYCTLRESWLHEGMLEDARIKIEALGWEGVSMLEYRWDAASGRYAFIELNPRFWAALHTALYAGMDMPRLLFDAFFERPDAPALEWRQGVRCRFTFPHEIGYVISCWRDRELPLFRRLWPMLEFAALSCNLRVHPDLFYPGDRAIYFQQLWNTLKEFLPPSRAASRT